MSRRARQLALDTTRGASLVEIAVTVAVITVMVIVVPKSLGSLITTSEQEVQRAVAHRVAEAELSAAFHTAYADLDETTATRIDTVNLEFETNGNAYDMDYVVERQVTVDTSLGTEFKRVTIRVSWPDRANPVGEVVKSTLVTQ